MKNKVQFLFFLLFSFCLVPLSHSFQNTECENEDSPFFIEIGFDTAFVVNKKTFELEKVLPSVPRKRNAQRVYESKGGDWSLRVSRNRKVATLKVGDSDEQVRFNCDI